MASPEARIRDPRLRNERENFILDFKHVSELLERLAGEFDAEREGWEKFKLIVYSDSAVKSESKLNRRLRCEQMIVPF